MTLPPGVKTTDRPYRVRRSFSSRCWRSVTTCWRETSGARPSHGLRRGRRAAASPTAAARGVAAKRWWPCSGWLTSTECARSSPPRGWSSARDLEGSLGVRHDVTMLFNPVVVLSSSLRISVYLRTQYSRRAFKAQRHKISPCIWPKQRLQSTHFFLSCLDRAMVHPDSSCLSLAHLRTSHPRCIRPLHSTAPARRRWDIPAALLGPCHPGLPTVWRQTS
jgi:hypothetical protein